MIRLTEASYGATKGDLVGSHSINRNGFISYYLYVNKSNLTVPISKPSASHSSGSELFRNPRVFKVLRR